MRRRLLGIALGLLLPVAAASQPAGPPPVSVSPGGIDGLHEVESPCPTFSWGPVDGALGYELVVLELSEELVDSSGAAPAVEDLQLPKATLREVLPTAALSWTPSGVRCLESGPSYAWVLRARTPRGSGGWSEARFFQVRPRPLPEGVEEALDVLARYLDARPADERSSLADAVRRLDLGKLRPGSPGRFGATVAQPGSAPSPSIGIQVANDNAANTSTAILGKALAGSGDTVGIRGEASSTTGVGLQGVAFSLFGGAAGVRGDALSAEGYGGYFFNWLGGAGLFASSERDFFFGVSGPDLVLGGTDDVDDEGKLFSDPLFPSSDLILYSNDTVRLVLNRDQDVESGGSTFEVFDGVVGPVFSVNEVGDTLVQGNLTLSGQAMGNLLTEADVQALINEHLTADHMKRVFVTSVTVNGYEIAGLGGANSRCQSLASAAGLTGEYLAWLNAAANHLRHWQGAFVLVDGTRVADGWDDLVDGSLRNAINLDENGVLRNGASVWTYTSTSGGTPGTPASPAYNCMNWTTAGTAFEGYAGLTSATDGRWTADGNDGCDSQNRHYCFEQ